MGRPRKEKPTHSSGMYVYKATIGHHFDGTPIRKAFYSSTSKEDAKAKANQYIIDKEVESRTGEHSEPKATTFESWAMKWLDSYKKGTIKEHTFNFTYRVNVEKYLIPYFKKAKLSDIKQIDIQRYFNTVKNDNGEPLAKSTLDKQKMILKSIFEAAIDNDLCYKNPVKNIKYQRVTETSEKHVYTKEQAETVLNYARKNQLIDIVIMLETGIRRSELLGLQWNDIDFERNTMHIQRAVTQTKGAIIIDKPKTETSDRIIPLSKAFTEYLQSFINDNIYVLGTDDKPRSPGTYAKQFKRIMDKINTDTGCPILTPHELRHTYGTLLREQDIDIYTIQKLMGHSDISVTASIYIHNDIEVLRKQAKID